jgi:hypothetical protein
MDFRLLLGELVPPRLAHSAPLRAEDFFLFECTDRGLDTGSLG